MYRVRIIKSAFDRHDRDGFSSLLWQETAAVAVSLNDNALDHIIIWHVYKLSFNQHDQYYCCGDSLQGKLRTRAYCPKKKSNWANENHIPVCWGVSFGQQHIEQPLAQA